MRIATSTCSHEKALWEKEPRYTCEEALYALKAAGFRVVDMNFESYCRYNGPMTQGNWKEWCENIKKLADELGLEICLAHAHFFIQNADDTINDWDNELIRRCIEGAGIMGVKWMVFHPYSLSVNGWYNRSKSMAYNIETFSDYERQCRPLGVHLAIENLFATTKTRSSRFGNDPQELIELVDTLNKDLEEKSFGICWDFGHAHLNGIDQSAALREIGKRLHALHVDDNHGMTDEHLAPYFGTIEWAPIMRALHEIGYEGDFTYEIFRFHYGLPDELQALTLEYTYKIAEYMLSIASDNT
jgi:sugar phosphate isomerase/epimerase